MKKELKKRYDKCNWGCKGKADFYGVGVKRILDCLDEPTQEKETPMGVSQWKAYGIKYGYWDYFNKVEAHDTKKDYCCACDYDVAVMDSKLKKVKENLSEELDKIWKETNGSPTKEYIIKHLTNH